MSFLEFKGNIKDFKAKNSIFFILLAEIYDIGKMKKNYNNNKDKNLLKKRTNSFTDV